MLDGYALPGMAARVAAWRPLVALDAAGWYLGEGMDADAARAAAAGAGAGGRVRLSAAAGAVLVHGANPAAEFSYLWLKPLRGAWP